MCIFLVSAGHENVVQELIGGGADVNRQVCFFKFFYSMIPLNLSGRKNEKGMTALQVLARNLAINF